MAVRKDKVQLEVEINGQKAGKTYQELIANARDLNRELRQLTPGTDAFVKKAAELKQVNDKLREINQSTKGVAQGLDEMRVFGLRLPGVFQNVNTAINALGLIGLINALVTAGRALFEFGKESTKLFNVQAKADAQLQATLASTQQAAGRTFEQLKQQASELQGVTLFGDEQTQQAQALLLTFTEIKEEVFDETVPIIQDVATAMATASGNAADLKGASIQIGKALNDPVKGVSALADVGVSFTQQQRDMIKSLVEGGEKAEAQRIILAELRKEFGGSAEAAAKAGTGGYTQIQNKLGDVKEQVGELISRGLERLRPVFEAVVNVTSKFVDALVNSGKNVNEFSGFVNITIKFLKLWNSALNEVRGVIVGIASAVLQMGKNAIGTFQQALIAAQLFSKEVELAFTFDGQAEAALEREIAVLRAKKDEIAASGRSVKDAFAEGFQKGHDIFDFFNDKVTLPKVPPVTVEGADDGTGTGTGGGGNKLKESIEKQARLAQEARLKEIQHGYEREKLLIEGELLRREVTEAEAAAKLLSADQVFYEQRLAALKQFGQEQTNEYLQTQNKLLSLTQPQQRQAAPEALPLPGIQPVASTGESRGKDIGAEEALQQLLAENEFREAAARQNFANLLELEQAFELQKLEIQQQAAAERLALAIALGEQDVARLTELENKKLAIEQQIAQQRLENERRTEQVKQATAQASQAVLGDLLGTSIQLLKSDENARKKNATAIKAFETARVFANLYAEISGYFKNSASTLPPAVAQAVAGAQAVFATIRAGVAVKNINSQKFAGGGAVKALPFFTGQVVQAAPNIPVQPNGDRVLATLKPGEVVLNEAQQAAMGGPSAFRRIGVPGFAGGGIVDTTPAAGVAQAAAEGGAAANAGLERELKAMRADLASVATVLKAMPTVLKAKVVLTELEDRAAELDNVRSEANV